MSKCVVCNQNEATECQPCTRARLTAVEEENRQVKGEPDEARCPLLRDSRG